MDELRLALRRLARAVVVITAQQAGRRYAMAATAISELSLDPPSMLVCVNRNASLFPVLAAGAPFGINILHHSQSEIASLCGGKAKSEERFLHGEWTEGAGGVPCLASAQANIICDTVKAIDHGTHAIFIGNVIEARVDGDVEPLIYVDGRYTHAAMEAIQNDRV